MIYYNNLVDFTGRRHHRHTRVRAHTHTRCPDFRSGRSLSTRKPIGSIAFWQLLSTRYYRNTNTCGQLVCIQRIRVRIKCVMSTAPLSKSEIITPRPSISAVRRAAPHIRTRRRVRILMTVGVVLRLRHTVRIRRGRPASRPPEPRRPPTTVVHSVRGPVFLEIIRVEVGRVRFREKWSRRNNTVVHRAERFRSSSDARFSVLSANDATCCERTRNVSTHPIGRVDRDARFAHAGNTRGRCRVSVTVVRIRADNVTVAAYYRGAPVKQ